MVMELNVPVHKIISQISTYNRWDASADDVVRLIVPTAMLTRGWIPKEDLRQSIVIPSTRYSDTGINIHNIINSC